ncbi:MAG: hypothetical protein IT502_01930 [Rubrivivax sp.]|nr:hypothetical protein [Rubrivivax sp.]
MNLLRPAVFAAKDPAEIVMLGFDFADALGAGVTITSQSVGVSVHAGTDAAPAALLSGPASAVGTRVVQRVVGGLAQVTYRVKAQIDASDGSRYVLAGLLPVRSA